jgi:hypothetical protein
MVTPISGAGGNSYPETVGTDSGDKGPVRPGDRTVGKHGLTSHEANFPVSPAVVAALSEKRPPTQSVTNEAVERPSLVVAPACFGRRREVREVNDYWSGRVANALEVPGTGPRFNNGVQVGANPRFEESVTSPPQIYFGTIRAGSRGAWGYDHRYVGPGEPWFDD